MKKKTNFALKIKIFYISNSVKDILRQRMVSKTREKLIEVARQLFDHKGVAKTTMNDIANASERGRRTIYTYFRNKKEIYNAVLESESESMVADLREIVRRDEPVATRLAQLLRYRLESDNVQSGSSLRLWLKFDLRRLERVNAMALKKSNAILRDLLDEGITEGVFDEKRCKLFATFIDDVLMRLVIPTTDNSDPSRRQAVCDSFVEFILDSITKK